MSDSDTPYGPMQAPLPVPEGPVLDRTGIDDDWFVITDFARVDQETGAIIETGHMSRAGLAHLAAEFDALYVAVTADAATQYFKLPEIKLADRTPCPAVLDGGTLRDLPVPCRISITNPGDLPSAYDWSDQAAALSFEHPGTYTVRVLSVPHLDGMFTVTID